MAETTEIPVDASGFDRLLGTIEGTTKASKEFGETFKKALMGEVLVNTINRISSGMKDGIAKEATQAAGAIAQGFFAGGPAGAAIAAFGVGVQQVSNLFEEQARTSARVAAAEKVDVDARIKKFAELEAKVRDSSAAVADAQRGLSAAQSAGATGFSADFAGQLAALDDAEAKASRVEEQIRQLTAGLTRVATESLRADTETRIKELQGQLVIASNSALAINKQIDAQIEADRKAADDARTERLRTIARERREALLAAQSAAALAEDQSRAARFADELDDEATQAQRLRDVERDGRAARFNEWQQDIRDFDAAQAVEAEQERVLAQQRADARRRIEIDAAKELYDSRMAAQNALLAMGAQARDGFANSVGSAVGALAQLDAAQIAAAASADDFGQQLAAGALKATSGVLQGVAQEATAKALLATAKGVGALATPGTQALAPGFFGEAAAYGAAAVAAGAGAVALNTAATAVAPAAPRQQGTQDRGGSGGGSGGGITVNLTTSRIYSTGSDVGADITNSLKNYERYRGYIGGR